ncbi:hypothetical protein CSA_000007, partial [Cucumis sativus]
IEGEILIGCPEEHGDPAANDKTIPRTGKGQYRRASKLLPGNGIGRGFPDSIIRAEVLLSRPLVSDLWEVQWKKSGN